MIKYEYTIVKQSKDYEQYKIVRWDIISTTGNFIEQKKEVKKDGNGTRV